MVQDNKYGPETSYEESKHHRMQVVYSHKIKEQQIFMDELKEIRKKRQQRVMKIIKKTVGPQWYQVLSVAQRTALDNLEHCIYQDLLEGRPIRTAGSMRELGLYPRPNLLNLMNCIYIGRDDPKEMLAQLFLMTYGHSIDGKQTCYCLNARLMLSGIFYLGLNNLIKLLRERFNTEPQKNKPIIKQKPKLEPPLASPYLQKMVAVLYERPKKKLLPPAPLPDLDDLNEPYEEEPPLPKYPPQPPPPPPPKKRLPRVYCDKLAGVINIVPHSSVRAIKMRTLVRNPSNRRIRGSKMCLVENPKKTFGMGSMIQKNAGGRRKKPVAPTTGLWNSQYMISGVYTLNGKTVFVLGNVSVLPSVGDLIHGGYASMDGVCVNVHCGYKARPQEPKPGPCECLKKWTDTIFKYVRSTKCYCGHYFDYGNEGTFPREDLPFFKKATRDTPHVFNYQTIYNLDPKSIHIEKEFKKLWDTDSMLRVDDEANVVIKDAKKKKKKSSTTCLGQNPQPEDFLKCAIRLMRPLNTAARLPDVHLVPELKEWMRRRLYGPISRMDKANLLSKSKKYWETLHVLALKGYGHVSPPFDPLYAGHTDWGHKQVLNDKFRKYVQRYRNQVYQSHANVTNMFWPSMCQAEFPDPSFREIYFSYLFGRIEDVTILHPYSSKEAMERKLILARKRYYCSSGGSVFNE